MNRFKQLGSRLVHSKHMLWGVAFASFMESLIVPIPLETILIPLMQARRKLLWAISAMALLGCIFGAALGYVIGYFLFGLIGDQLIALLSTPEQFETIRQQIHLHGFWYVLSVGVTPIPFQIAMLAAGVTGRRSTRRETSQRSEVCQSESSAAAPAVRQCRAQEP